MKLTKPQLKQIIKEAVESDERFLSAIENLTSKIEELDVSVDFLAAAFIGGDPLSIGGAQSRLGRAYRPSRKGVGKSDLEEMVKDELLRILKETNK